MKIGTIFYVMLLSFASIFGSKDLKEGNKAFKNSNYVEAIGAYERYLAEEDEVDNEIRTNLATCYYVVNDFENALKQYNEVGESNLTVDALQKYGEILFYMGDYKKTQTIFEKPEMATLPKSKQILENITWLNEKKSDSSSVEVVKTGIKTFGQSFGAQYYKNGIIYSSASNSTEILDYRKAIDSELKVDQKGFAFLNLFYSPIHDGVIGQPVLFSETLAFDYHVGAVAFSKDDYYIYYTKVIKLENKSDVLQIFEATYTAGTWSRERALSFNSETYSCAHPAISVTGDTLYFVSDKPGGLGGKDIYYSTKSGNKWSNPVNVGRPVNTAGDELFPFVDDKNILYFASDGHPGYGGLDVFKAPLNIKNPGIVNMGYGINSAYDDFAYVVNPDDIEQGLLSSNRDSKGKADNIYQLKKPIVIEKVEVVDENSFQAVEFVSTVRNGLSGKPIKDANITVTIVDQNRVIIDSKTDSTGVFKADVITNNLSPEEPLHIMVVVRNEGFEPYSKMMSAGEFFGNNSVMEEINLVPVLVDEQKVTIPQDRLQFELNSDVLSYSAKRLMERWFDYLESHKGTRIRLNAHTDSQGNLDYNLQLSQRRADNAKAYLMQRGIADDRIISRGYGERYIINRCVDGVSCSDKEHEENRRIEIIVVED